ncbi:MAG: ABC transporter ATP-binding protein [Phycisphaerae bacterium]
MLQAQSIEKRYETQGGSLEVLRDASLSLEPGESAVIMGPSGSGKSTFLNIIGTLERPSGGKLTLDGTDPFALTEPELAGFRNRRVGFIFQDHHLLPQCTVLENVLLPTLAEKGAVGDTERARKLLERVGLSDRLDHRPAELSGGERQRTAIARALINRPALVLADEPTGNLDRTTAQAVADLLAELPAEEQAVLLVVTHSEGLADRFQRRLDLLDGTLRPHG